MGQADRIPSLDGLRAVSISLVILSHSLGTLPPIETPIGTLRLLNLGGLGVRVFFVISGFLITTLLLEERRARGRNDLRGFYLRRTLRIFPPYYTLLLAVVLLNAAGQAHVTARDLVHAATYTVNYHPARAWEIGHAWSLSVEEQFYLLWPALIVLAGTRRALWLAAAVLLVCPITRLAYWYWVPTLIRYEVGYRFETVADSIAVGCLLAGAWPWLTASAAYRAALRSRLFIAVPLAVVVVAMLSERSRSSLLLGVTLQNLGIAACLAWCVGNRDGVVGRVLNWRPVVFVGVISYSLYLWQQLFFRPDSSSALTHFPLNVALTVVAAVLSHRLVEQPALRLRRALERRRAVAAARAAMPAAVGASARSSASVAEVR